MSREKSQKILYLESLRGIAAISVALFHALHYNSIIKNIGFIKNSGLMVDFFFVLSGFVIAYSYAKKLNSYKELLIFQIKRFLRLYPLHFLTLIIFVIIEILKYYAQTKFGFVSLNDRSINDGQAFLHNIFLTHSFFIEDLSFNGQSWSISTEFYTYLIFGFLLVSFRNNKFMFMISFFIIFMASLIGVYSIHSPTFISPDNVTNGIGGISRCIYCFFMGAIIYFIYQSKRFTVAPIWQYIVLIATVWYVSGDFSYQFILAPIFFSFLIFIFLNSGKSLLKYYLNNQFLIYLGTISYGIYMIHGFVWWCINRVLVNIFNNPYECSEIIKACEIETSSFVGNLSLIFGLIVIYFLSVLSYKYVEMPINSYRHKLKI